MSYLVLARKYRPQTFSQVVGQEHVTRTLKNAIASGRLGHAFLFSGIRGVGKTSVARILACTLNCKDGAEGEACGKCSSCLEVKEGISMDVVELDAASNRGIDDIRALRETVYYSTGKDRTKVYIIDEVHMLSKDAFNALLKTLEEPPPRVIFILATTEPHKVPLTIQSRCQRYDFRRIPSSLMTGHLEEICRAEGISISRPALHRIAIASEGSLRDAQSLLDQVVSFAGEKVGDADVDTILGSLDRGKVLQLLTACFAGRAGEALTVLGRMIETGGDPFQIALELITALRDLLLLREVEKTEGLIDRPAEEERSLAALAAGCDPALLRLRFALMSRAEERMRRASQPRFHLELALVHMARAAEIAALTGPSSSPPGPALRREAAAPSPLPGKAPETADAQDTPGAEHKGISFDSIATEEETWEELVAHIGRKDSRIGSLLEHLVPVEMAGDVLIIGGRKGEFYLDTMKEKDKFAVLRRYVKEFFHREMKVRLVEMPEGERKNNHALVGKKEARESDFARRIKKETLENETVRAALEIFAGEVERIEVLPGAAAAERMGAGESEDGPAGGEEK